MNSVQVHKSFNKKGGSMTKVCISTIIILMAMNIMLYAQEKYQGRMEIKLVMIYQLDSTKLHSRADILSEVDDVLRKKNVIIPQEDIGWLLNKIRLDIIHHTNILHTVKGEEIHIPYFASLPHSSNYEYFILNTCDYEDRIPLNQQTKLIKTSDGSVLWKINNTMMLYAFISNDGNVTVDMTPAPPPSVRNLRNVRFYNRKGDLTKTVDDLLSFPTYADMTDIGNLFTVMSSEAGIHLVSFNHQGNEIWRVSVPVIEAKINFFNSSKYLIYTSLSDDGHTLLIDDKGAIIGDYDFVIHDGSFSSDSKYFIFDVAGDLVHYLNTITGEAVSYEIGNTPNSNMEYYFENLFDKLGTKGVIMLDENGVIHGVYLEGGEVSPNKHLFVTPIGIFLSEVEYEK
jgi:hypothetical protein